MMRDQEPAEMFLAEQEEEQEVAGDMDLLFLLMMIYSEFSNFSRRGLPLSSRGSSAWLGASGMTPEH
ncbi:unnamed protein product [Boreogadus saida]